MKTFASFIVEGGNIKVGDHQAAPFKVTAQNREERSKDIHDSLHHLNKSFHDEHGHDLFHNGKAHYAGSSMHLMDKKISHADFAKHKPEVGDVDVHVPHEHGDKLHSHLKAGAKFGKYTVLGTKKHGSDVSAVMKHDNGENHQFDFVKGKHGAEEQSFLHSSNWHDVTHGIKGLHHKILMNAAGGDKHKFSISGGLKSREDDKDTGHQHPKAIAHALFGKDADHSKIHSFHGVAELIKKHKPASEHQAIYDKFKDSVKTNNNDHSKAIAHLKKTLGTKDEVKESINEDAKVGSQVHIVMPGYKHHNKTGVVQKITSKPGSHSAYTVRPGYAVATVKLEDGQTAQFRQGSWRIEKRKSKLNLSEEAEHHASVIPLVGFSPISHMGHAHDLGGAMKKLPGKKHVGISQKADVFSPEERSHIMKKQWGQKDVNHHFTKSGGDTIGHAYHSLPKGGKKHLHILVGGDRTEFAHGLKKSLEAGKIPEMNGHKWDSIHIHTPDDSGRAHGMSGTKMRAASVMGDHEEFHRHLGKEFSKEESKGIMHRIKHAIENKQLKIKR